MAESLGPHERALAAAVARRHYLAGESKVDIASALGISRFKVARLLDAAHELGMVRIEVVDDGLVDMELSQCLKETYGLHHCSVVVASPDAGRGRGDIGRAAADLLTEIITPSDVLGLPWSRSVADLIAALTALPPIPVVQLSGSLVVPGETRSPVDIVTRAARLAGGEAHVFFAPLVLDSAASAAAMRRQQSVADAFAQAYRVTIAAAGMGAWNPESSTICRALSPDDRQAAADTGVVGEMMGICFDSEGRPVATALGERVLTLTPEQLRAIPEVIGIVRGAAKADVLRPALAGRLVTSLVVDSDLANVLLHPSSGSVSVSR
ncbi:sugar-binding transcriptional regulator [Nostocoides vanveenii]|uniref:Sugar-binding domain-containing protein n=1 Tax=Nostocoides vanveenii TaxID=330835 RepID=A0ABP4X016_9MICO